MDDLLSSLVSGTEQSPEDEESSGDPLAGFMDNLAKEGLPTGPQGADAPAGGQESRDMGELLGALMGGGAPAGGQEAPDMSGLLGALMGGGAPAGGQEAPDMSGLLGALMGGSQASGSAPSPLTSIVVGLAEKLGLPPQIAELVVGFVLNKLLSGSRGAAQVASRSGVEVAVDPDMETILTRVNSGQEVDGELLASTGMTAELAQQTGLDPEKAEASLQKVLSMLSGKTG